MRAKDNFEEIIFSFSSPLNPCLSAGGSGLGSAGLETCQSAKNKHVDMVYSCGASYKKPKKPAAGILVESSTGPLCLEDLSGNDSKPAVSWGSRMGSIFGSVSGLSDVENLGNLVAKEMSYVDSGENNEMNEMYVLEQPLKAPLFATMTDDNNDGDDSVLLPPKISGSNQLPSFKSRILKSHSFGPVKSFVLDVNLLAVPGRTNSDKLMSIKNFFYKVDSFRGASTSSKFPSVIHSTFTNESSLIRARELAVNKNIVVNGNLKKANIYLNWEVIIKEILVDLLKLAVKSVFFKFGKIISIRMQLIGLWQKTLIEFESSKVVSLVTSKWSVFVKKNSVCVALAVNNKQTWMSRDCHQALLYTLPVGTLVHDLSDLLVLYGGKTCFIGRNPGSYVRNWCAIICFENENARLAAVSTVSIFKDVSLHWASFVLASCTRCEWFGHTIINCSVGRSSGVCGKRVVINQNWVHLGGIYKKKLAPITCPVSFGGKTWAQVASGTSSCVYLLGSSGSGLCSGLVHPSVASDRLVVSHLGDHLAVLGCSLELLANHVSGILVRLDSFGVAFLVPSSLASPFVVSVALSSEVNSDIIVDNTLSSSDITFSVTIDAVVDLSTSSSKVFTTKVGGLETKLVTLEALVGSVLNKLNLLCSDSGLSAPIGINNCAKQTDIVRWHKDMNNMVSIFDGVRVFTFGLDSGYMESGVAIILDSSLAKHVCKISEVPGRLLLIRLFFKNKLFVFILGLYADMSSAVHFSQTGKVNSLIAKAVNESSFVILGGDFNEDGSHKCASFKKCFDLGLVKSLGEELFFDAVVDCGVDGIEDYFNTDHKAVSVSVGLRGLLNYDIKNASEVKWFEFRDAMTANVVMFLDEFVAAKWFSDLDIMVLLAEGMFKKKWFNSFDCVFNKVFSQFYKLELLGSKLVKTFWLDSVGTLSVKFLFLSGAGFDVICFGLAKTKKFYCSSKLLESKCAEKSSIRQAIERRIESFEVDKSHIIRSILKCPFRKVVLDHLMNGEELVLKSELVKSKVDGIMEGWTRKHVSLDHVFDGVFSDVIHSIGFDEMFGVISNLPNGKTAGLSVLDMLLVLLNLCLDCKLGVLTNTHPIALIETACKILSKILLDQIFLACNTFDVLCGDNFSVLKSTSTQSPIFAIGLIIEDALEKN
ncbi:hypothetical protein G9A89_018065 [Geosiphon pyriformis]|nr:hypothetical protein G9A89_018065 [Geosiphon pyriformis]